MNETKLNGASMDIVAGNVQKLKAIFPEVFCEDSIDFEKLQAVLGNYIDIDNERYNFTWWGKSQALRLAQTPSTGTLRPCKEESKDWDTTQNMYIEGDNLEVLKLLQKTYHGKVKMIYIDPPYNTGKDFVYKDNYKDNLTNYLQITGQLDEAGNKLNTNNETSGRYHTNWLNMMYPRLRLARKLLTDKGIIFISIDENEVDNLKKVCNEVFGEDNFVGQITILSNPKGRSQDKYIANCHDYLVMYSKTVLDKGEVSISKSDEEISKDYTLQDEKGFYRELELRNTHREFGRHNRPNLYYPIYVSGNGDISLDRTQDNQEAVLPIWEDGLEGCWTWGLEKAKAEIELLVAKKIKHNWKIYRKAYAINDGEKPLKQMKSIWLEKKYHTEKGQGVFNELFNSKNKIFQSPKSVDLIMDLIRMSQSYDEYILDFFSGSATTAHAVMELNKQDGGKRKFIMVQLPQLTDEKEEAHKVGLKNICEIGKKRIRLVGEKLDKEGVTVDSGFRVFKLDTSNIKKWNPDYENLEQTLFDQIDNFVEGRTDLDVVFEIMLKYGIDLTFPIEEYDVSGKKVYSIGFGALIICLDNDITMDLAMGIIKLKEELAPDIMRVVFKDNGFRNDSVKTNVKEIFKLNGVDEMVSI